jgi:stage IV sporulation protein FB
MNWSLKLMTVRGIEIKVHLSFVLILLWGAYIGSENFGGREGALFGLLLITLLFVCVVLHELGHSFEAMRFGVTVHDITLWPIGGIARLASLPEKPSQELRIALAGPAVNFIIVAVLWAVVEVGLGLHVLDDLPKIVSLLEKISGEGLLIYLGLANLVLGLFNLIPAFPMDGGRVLRSLLAMRLEFARATRIAVFIGQGVAIAMGLLGLFYQHLSLLLVGAFVFWGAGQEGQFVSVRSRLRGVRVQQILPRRVEILSPTDSLAHAVELTLATFQTDFPVLAGERLVGLLTESDLISALGRMGVDASVARAMRTHFPVVRLEMSLFDAQQMLSAARLSAIPVMQGEYVVGLLTLRDIGEIYRLCSVRPELFAREYSYGK